MTDTERAQSGIADALSQLSEDTRLLVRAEIESAQKEAWQRLKQAAPGIGLLALAGACGIGAGASAYRLVLRLLEKPLPPTLAALVATAGFGAASMVSVTKGMALLRDAPLPLPVDTVRETAQVVQEAANQAAA